MTLPSRGRTSNATDCDCETRARHLAQLLTAAVRQGRASIPGALYVDPEAAYLAPWCDVIQGSHLRVIFAAERNAWVVEPIQ